MESMEELFDRVNNFYNFIIAKHIDQSILIVAHSGVIKLLECLVKYKKYNKELLDTIEFLDNSCIKQIL